MPLSHILCPHLPEDQYGQGFCAPFSKHMNTHLTPGGAPPAVWALRERCSLFCMSAEESDCVLIIFYLLGFRLQCFPALLCPWVCH